MARYPVRMAFASIITWVLAGAIGYAQVGATGTSMEDYENRIELKGTAGYADFPDESPLHHFVMGGSARIRLFKGLGIEPELTYMYRSQQDRDFFLMLNVVWEFRRHSRMVPYLIGGAGLMNHRRTWRIHEWSVNARVFQFGFGTKFFLSQRIFIAPDVRIGWEPHIRVAGTFGYVLKR